MRRIGVGIISIGLMMADMQSKAAFQSAQIQRDLTTQADTDKFFGQATITTDGVTF